MPPAYAAAFTHHKFIATAANLTTYASLSDFFTPLSAINIGRQKT